VCDCEARIKEFGDPCGENCATATKSKNQRWQNFCLHQFVSKGVLKKEPSMPSRIWDAHHPPNTLGTTLLLEVALVAMMTPWRSMMARAASMTVFLLLLSTPPSTIFISIFFF
jgi:hypothetical protein